MSKSVSKEQEGENGGTYEVKTNQDLFEGADSPP